MAARSRTHTSPYKMVRRSTALLAAALTFAAGMTIGSMFSTGTITPVPEAPQPSAAVSSHVQSAQQLTQTQPGNADAWIHLGDAYYDARDFSQAIAAYERGLSLNPDKPDAHTDLGTAYRAVKEYDKAIAHYNEALVRQPRHNNARLNKGIVLYYDLNRKNEALAVWNDLLRINPDAKGPNNMMLKDFISRLSAE